MVKRLADSNIWQKDWFLELTDKQKLLVKFLFDNCDCAGIYEISNRVLKNCFQEEIKKEDFEAIKQVKFISKNKIFIEDFIKFQYNTSIPLLNPSNNVHKGIIASLKKNNLLRVSEGLGNPCLRVLDKDKVKDKDKDTTTLSKQILTSNNDDILKIYGDYQNVCLTKRQYEKLLSMCASEKLLNELINSFSSKIEVGKERPYTAELPNAHFERLRSYYNYRRRNPEKFKHMVKNGKEQRSIAYEDFKALELPEITKEDDQKAQEFFKILKEKLKP
jgi:hypothetical protein